ncbi:LysR family transcriptional regulator [Sporomusa sphaeroides]|uniref:LysR family transcriptional regulator n=1 Tax=Sporomusa sphaeroides TaxID=47679 RepID=UPI002C213288|nr:LysR family transcriptional regulator [Sporomusa sphaeroides]HML35081.1 LysR family transcriptional regulator [Sporomusa sphaeroides]
MELRQLQIFVTAAQTLNFTKAAMKLGYTQSNITSQIRQLEEELQVKLFERFGKGLQLTSEGKHFQKSAENILEQCEKAKSELTPDVFQGVLTIGAAETLCVNRLPKILLEYRKKYPRIEIRVQTESCYQLFQLLRTNSVDIALALASNIQQPDMIVKTLYEEAMTVVISPLHPLAQQQKLKPVDLTTECLILTAEGCGYRPVVLAALEHQQVKPGAIMELSSVGAIKECTACGLGIAILPKIAVHDELLRKKLIELNWLGPPLDVKTQLIYHRDKWLSPAIQAFLELCETMGK